MVSRDRSCRRTARQTATRCSRWPRAACSATSMSAPSARSPPKRWPKPSCAPSARRRDCPAIRPRPRSADSARAVTLLLLLIAYSIGLIVLGTWVGRTVRQTSGFFIADRRLGTGLLFSTFLAANIGAGSTIAATGYAYTNGLAAWWWNGSAGLGSLVLALWIGPRVWRAAARHDLMTVGDLLEHHFGPAVRGLAAAIIWMGSFAILCAQLKGAAEVLGLVGGVPYALGAALSAVAATGYLVLGGLLSAAWVNRVQLVVKLVGFAVAALFASVAAGGSPAVLADPDHLGFWRGQNVGWPTLFLLGPRFFLSPGLFSTAFVAVASAWFTRSAGWTRG